VTGDLDLFTNDTPIVAVDDHGIPTTTSLRIADGTQLQHKNVLELIRNNLADFEEFGLVAFETRPRSEGQHGGGGVTYAVLNEEHATLALTYLRNTDIVRDFKKRLVREFYAMRNAAPTLTEDEIVHQALAITSRRVEALTAKIAELEPKAEFYDDLMDADGAYSFGATAKALGWGRNVMLRELRRMGVVQGNRLPYQRYAHHFKVVPQTYSTSTGETVATATTYVLPSGIEFLRKKLAGSEALT
jgi:phage antirepressor YoqD-like protein